MSKHPLEQEVLEDNIAKFNFCLEMCARIDGFEFGKDFQEVKDIFIKRGAGYSLMINYLSKNNIMGEHNK